MSDNDNVAINIAPDTTVSAQETTRPRKGPQYPTPPIATTTSPGNITAASDPNKEQDFSYTEFYAHVGNPDRALSNEYMALKLVEKPGNIRNFYKKTTEEDFKNLGTYKRIVKMSKEGGWGWKFCFSKGSVVVPEELLNSPIKIFRLVNPVVMQTNPMFTPLRTGGRKSRKSRKSMKKRSTRRRRH